MSLDFLTEFGLDESDSFLVFGFHLGDNLLVHLDHLGEGLLNSVPLTLQELHLVMKHLVCDLQLSPLA